MIHAITYTYHELITAIANGDQRAFAHLYDHYSQALFGVIFKIVNSHEDAEDVLQQTFIKIWHNFDSYNESKGRLYTWMMAITRNLAFDFLRSKNVKNRSKVQSFEDFANHLKSNNSTDAINDFIGLEKILSVLNKEEQDLINLAYIHGFTQAELAEALQIPLGTVKTKIRNSLKKLRLSVLDESNPFE